MEGSKEEDVAYVIAASSSSQQPKAKNTACEVVPTQLPVTHQGGTVKLRPGKYLFLGFCVKARAILCIIVFSGGRYALISHTKRSCELFYGGI